MANKFELSAHARQDLKEIWIYLAENNYAAANRALRELGQKFQLLANNPLLGRVQDDLILNLRRFPYKKYNIFYFPVENGIEIYRVLHGSRNIEELFEDFIEGLEP
jgi:toxin ParE1/3/4